MPTCPHDGPRPFRGCSHLLEREQVFLERFTGRDQDVELVCEACTTGDVELCAACHARAREGGWEGIINTPELRTRASSLWFDREDLGVHGIRPRAVAPIVDGERARWLAIGDDARLHLWDLDARTTTPLHPIPPALVDLAQPLTLRVSRDGTLAAIANTRGLTGAIVDVATGAVTLSLARGDNCTEHCNFSVAFVERGGRTLVIHATDWNRLDISDPRTGERLTARTFVEREHHLDYFHCELHVSPGGTRVADTGWVWHPYGVTFTWSLDRWLDANVWESDDGPTKTAHGRCAYDWDRAFAWLDEDRAAVYGYGEDETWNLPAARIVDATTGEQLRWFYGPDGDFVFDHHLVSVDRHAGAQVWDTVTGERLAHEPAMAGGWYHPGAKMFASVNDGGDVTAWRVCGHHTDAPWLTPKVRALADSLRADPGDVAILGDALEEAGCDDEPLLAHCRRDHAHAPRCWAVDRLIHALHRPQHR